MRGERTEGPVAVVGCGGWGQNVARCFAELGALAAVVDHHREVAEALASRFGCRACSLDDALGDPSIAAVAIVTQPRHHGEIGTASLAAGKHVFVEKPLALSIAEADALAEAARAARRVLMVGHILHYHPGFAALRALVSSGALGRILRVQARRLNLGRIRKDEDALWCLAPHDISMVLALLGARPTSVDAFTEHLLLGQPPADAAVVRLAFAAGPTALIEVSWLNPVKEQRLTLIGTEGMAVFDDTAPWERKLVHFRHAVRMGADVPAIEPGEPTAVVLTPEEPLLAECRHFLDCVETGREPLTGPDEALAVVQVLDRAARAAAGFRDQVQR